MLELSTVTIYVVASYTICLVALRVLERKEPSTREDLWFNFLMFVGSPFFVWFVAGYALLEYGPSVMPVVAKVLFGWKENG